MNVQNLLPSRALLLLRFHEVVLAHTHLVQTGVYAIVPLTHVLFSGVSLYSDAIYGIALMGALYIVGALLYGFRIPERFFTPGTFDLVFSSHQIFHVCVVVAAYVHYLTVHNHYMWRIEHSVCEY